MYWRERQQASGTVAIADLDAERLYCYLSATCLLSLRERPSDRNGRGRLDKTWVRYTKWGGSWFFISAWEGTDPRKLCAKWGCLRRGCFERLYLHCFRDSHKDQMAGRCAHTHRCVLGAGASWLDLEAFMCPYVDPSLSNVTSCSIPLCLDISRILCITVATGVCDDAKK